MILCEADFAIKGLASYQMFGQTFWLTSTHVSMIIVTVVLLIFAFAANRCMKRAKDVPTGFQNVVEIVVEKCFS